jgi:hypothetical protein
MNQKRLLRDSKHCHVRRVKPISVSLLHCCRTLSLSSGSFTLVTFSYIFLRREDQNPKRHIVHKEEASVIVFMVLSYFKLEARILSLRIAVPSLENAADF